MLHKKIKVEDKLLHFISFASLRTFPIITCVAPLYVEHIRSCQARALTTKTVTSSGHHIRCRDNSRAHLATQASPSSDVSIRGCHHGVRSLSTLAGCNAEGTKCVNFFQPSATICGGHSVGITIKAQCSSAQPTQ